MTESTSPSAPAPAAGLLGVALFVLRQWRLILGLPLLLAVAVVAVGLVLPRDYTVSAVFVPRSSQNSLARLAGFAAQLGVALPAQEANESPDFYADLLRSGHILRQLVRTRFEVRRDGRVDSLTLVAFYRVRGQDSAQREDRAIRRLGDDLQANVALKTGVVRFSVTTRDAALSLQVARKAIELVNTFNLQTRQSRAGAERRFVEQRLGEARGELREAEDRIQAWMQNNRDYRSSPRLGIELERLQREVTLRQTVVTTLAQAFEQARIDEVRDTPVLTIVDEPVLPSRPDSRRLAAKGILTLLLGGLVAFLVASSREAVDVSDHSQPDEMAEIRRRLSAFPLVGRWIRR